MSKPAKNARIDHSDPRYTPSGWHVVVEAPDGKAARFPVSLDGRIMLGHSTSPTSAPRLWCCYVYDTGRNCIDPATKEIRWGATPDDYTHSCDEHVEALGGLDDGVVTTLL
jgi:hypothetical protein